MGESVRRRIELAPLADDQIEAILKWQLGGDDLESSLANEITIRASGNPAAAVEYLRSALEAGVLRPSWGTFSVDAEALASLDLPTDVRGLALRRLDALRPATRWLLTEASVIGSSFNVDLLATITRWPSGDVHVALGEAANARVVEAQGSERYVFLHEGVRDVLLASVDERASRKAHEMLARALQETGDNRPEVVYDIARHYALGEIATDPKRSFKPTIVLPAWHWRRRPTTMRRVSWRRRRRSPPRPPVGRQRFRDRLRDGALAGEGAACPRALPDGPSPRA